MKNITIIILYFDYAFSVTFLICESFIIFPCLLNLHHIFNCQFLNNPSQWVKPSSHLRLFLQNQILLLTLILTTNRYQTNSVTEFITMCVVWLQTNNFHPIYITLFKTTFSSLLEQEVMVLGPISKFFTKSKIFFLQKLSIRFLRNVQNIENLTQNYQMYQSLIWNKSFSLKMYGNFQEAFKGL